MTKLTAPLALAIAAGFILGLSALYAAEHIPSQPGDQSKIPHLHNETQQNIPSTNADTGNVPDDRLDSDAEMFKQLGKQFKVLETRLDKEIRRMSDELDRHMAHIDRDLKALDDGYNDR